MRAGVLKDAHPRLEISVRLGILDRRFGLFDKRPRLLAAGLLGCGGVAFQLDQPAVQAHHHGERIFRIGLWIRWLWMKIGRWLQPGIQHTDSVLTRTPAT
jgi:hypothetical protein